jgi:hypothetical protein
MRSYLRSSMSARSWERLWLLPLGFVLALRLNAVSTSASPWQCQSAERSPTCGSTRPGAPDNARGSTNPLPMKARELRQADVLLMAFLTACA